MAKNQKNEIWQQAAHAFNERQQRLLILLVMWRGKVFEDKADVIVCEEGNVFLTELLEAFYSLIKNVIAVMSILIDLITNYMVQTPVLGNQLKRNDCSWQINSISI